MTLSRRSFLKAATAIGASLAWVGPARASSVRWNERRDLYPQGVASGDPEPHSVLLWTRRPYAEGTRQLLTVEVAEDQAFHRVIAHAKAPVTSDTDWTARVLLGGLAPARTYWYRFTDADGNGSRVGRTITAPLANDTRTVNFAFVSCQDINEGKLNAYRRMIYEDERAAACDQLGFVLHLGDFIYEVVQYPDEVKTRYDRTIYEITRIPDGHKIGNFHIPLTLEGYRAIYRAYLLDPDLQDARARWPFVAMWDNHEFSWQGWQSMLKAGAFERPGQSIKVAANQAWFEYLPSRVSRGKRLLDRFDAPAVKDVPVKEFDANGLGTEPNNLTAINSLKAYRALRYGRHLELIVTDQRSYRSADPFSDPSLDKLGGDEFLGMFPETAMQVLDGGRAFNGGKPPADVHFDELHVPNPQRNEPPQTLLGMEQKAWFKDKLRKSTATWKIWGNSMATLESRADPQNLPAGMTKQTWPANTFAALTGGDYSTAWAERSEIYNLVRDAKVTGFAIVSGDRHTFWAGYASAALPPGKFEPVGLSFVGASLCSPGTMESQEHRLKKDAPLRALFLADREGGAKPDWTQNMLLRHGVRSCLDYAKHFDLKRARALSNPDLAPHLEFVDLGGHGYSKVQLSATEMRTEFVCIPRPVTRSERPDGGPLRYRVVHTAAMWKSGSPPKLKTTVIEGDVGLSI
jgi:alkaline phosphatase D